MILMSCLSILISISIFVNVNTGDATKTFFKNYSENQPGSLKQESINLLENIREDEGICESIILIEKWSVG